jgi:predicted alpha/beta hydrolase
MPEFEHLSEVEDTMYRRILRNSYKGAIKGALTGLFIGVAAGAILGALALTFAPALLPLAVHGIWGAMTAGAIAVSAVVVPFAARFGGVAGVQSTRDARRFMQADRLPKLTPSEEKEKQRIFELSHSVPTGFESAADNRSFQDMLAKQQERNKLNSKA